MVIKRFDKKGSQFVEASLVLPLVFLITLSLIGLVGFHLESFEMQLNLQREILAKVDIETSSFKSFQLKESMLLSPGGVFEGILEREYTLRWLKLNEGWAVRTGGLGNVLTE